MKAMSTRRGMPRWPLFFIASPAAVAVWSGWVALGGMCGFGVVNLLPGIWHGFSVNTAITLPVGVEAYGAYALGAWLIPGTPERARAFARRSAIGSLALGMGGQVIYHLLAAAHAVRAPWPVTVLVSCMPVVTLGFGAALTHLLRAGEEAAPDAAEVIPPIAVQVTPEVTAEASLTVPPVVIPEAPPVVTPPAAPVVTPGDTPPATPKPRRIVPSKATDDELAELVLPLFEDGSEVTRYRVVKAIREAAGGKASIGDKRAGDILELARRKRVVPIGARRQA